MWWLPNPRVDECEDDGEEITGVMPCADTLGECRALLADGAAVPPPEDAVEADMLWKADELETERRTEAELDGCDGRQPGFWYCSAS